MGKFRVVQGSLWTDKKVLDEFSPEDRFFWLYILTNPRTTQLGIYEFSMSDATKLTGYNRTTIEILLNRFEHTYDVIKYNGITGEIAIKNFLRHNIITGGKPVLDCLIKEAKKIKDEELFTYIFENLKKYKDLNKTVLDFMEVMGFELSENETSFPEVKTEDKPSLEKILNNNFNVIYNLYPKKVGRTEAFKRYKLWVTKGRVVSGKKIKLTDHQIYHAVEKYIYNMKESESELRFYKNFDTFMGDQILDYIDFGEDKAC